MNSEAKKKLFEVGFFASSLDKLPYASVIG
jgi:hypothetical protein